ncbi:hypothetical protein BD769DRAFT_1512937 [Suillus cothurnatus]|nr:hypothetical protein BD769DRAFT_1512937 [Suillus cothurnatus]
MTHSIKYMNLFQSRKLRYCSILFAQEDMQPLVSRCAALEHLNIQFDVSAPDGQSPLSNSVRLCKRLVSLSCPPLDWAAWTHLSNLPTLLSVQIDAKYSDSPWPLKRNTVKLSPFLNVTTLFIRIPSVAYIIAVMEHSQFPSLTKLNIRHEVPSSAELEQLFRALSHCKACQTLKEITITFDDHQDNDDQDPDNFLTLIPHFLCFTQLEILQLYFHGSHIYLGNDVLLQAMSTWPHVRILEIQDSGLIPSHVTFRGLFTALRQCPHLRVLRVPINTVTIDVDPDTEPLPHTSLHRLELETTESPIESAEAVARIIFTLLPRVAEVSPSTIGGDWDAVNFYLISWRAAARAAGAASND